MRVVRLHGPHDLRVADEPAPTRSPGTTLVRVTAVGICGSDLHWYVEGGIGDARLDRPLVPGHEIAGVVADGPREGTRVAVDPALPCRRCPSCEAGHRNLCPSVAFAGHSGLDGGLREYMTWPDTALHPLPPGMSDADGAMLEPLGVAVHALDLAHLRFGMSVAVIGCGPIGLLLVQLARASGATYVLATDPLAHRRDAALRLGADAVYGDIVDTTDVVGAMGEADVAFEVAGTDEALRAALTVTRPGARVVLVGIPATDQTSFPASLARRKGLTLVLARRMGDVYPRAITAVERGIVDVASLITARYPLGQASDAFHHAETRAGIKTIVEPNPSTSTT
jgi:L-iditol 2-dehydrogenase